MATVVSITNPITGAVEQVDKLDHTAQQIDDAVALFPQLSNPNLLDNPNFAVNQRGTTSVPGSPAAYIVDRWNTYGYAAATVSVLENGHISMSGGNASGGSSLRQIFEKTLPAGTYTLSAKVVACENPNANGVFGMLNMRKGTATVGDSAYIKGAGVISKTFTVADGAVDGISIGVVSSGTVEFEYVKLELGTQQTLAHQDENGNWQLNEIPNYGEQLAGCQYFNVKDIHRTIVGGLNYAGDSLAIPVKFPRKMRAVPSIKIKQVTVIGWGDIPIDKVEPYWREEYGFFVRTSDVSTYGSWAGKPVVVTYEATADL